jgi:putative ABC transport system permease protein
MTGARWRKVRADLLSNRLRSGLAIVSLAVGTTAVGAMFLAGGSFASSLEATNPPAAMLVTGPFPPDLVDDVVAHPTVRHAEGRRLHQVQLADASGVRRRVQLVAMADFAGNHTARIAPVEGPWPPEPGTLVLERASAAELGFATGEPVAIETAPVS